LRAILEPQGAWDPNLRNDLAGAHMSRGNAKQDATGFGPDTAIADYDVAIEIRTGLRAMLELQGAWDPNLRNDLANTHINRGIAKKNATEIGPGSAIADYDVAIEIMTGLRAILEPQGAWDPNFRNDLAIAHFNRGSCHQSADALALACVDARSALAISEPLLAAFGDKSLSFWRTVDNAARQLAEQTCGALQAPPSKN
jgi:hypothetical protein